MKISNNSPVPFGTTLNSVEFQLKVLVNTFMLNINETLVQCRPRLERGFLTGSSLFALSTGISMVIIKSKRHPFCLKWTCPKSSDRRVHAA